MLVLARTERGSDATDTRKVAMARRRLRADASDLLVALGLDEAELSLVACDDPFIHALNREHRHKDKPTDVLSFPQDEKDVLGDVVISVDTAQRQADAAGHPLRTELRVLLVHGVLHLLGFDHEEDDEAEVMETKERELLAELGWKASG